MTKILEKKKNRIRKTIIILVSLFSDYVCKIIYLNCLHHFAINKFKKNKLQPLQNQLKRAERHASLTEKRKEKYTDQKYHAHPPSPKK